jgi:putative ATP-dependent endonuclease of OLD family
MHLSRIQIANFRNFKLFDVPTERNLVFGGQNRVGKSNLIHALRLVLDASLPDTARQLKLSDFWDGCDLSLSPEIRVQVGFADFDSELALLLC